MGSEFSGQQGRALAPITVDYYGVLAGAIDASKDDPDRQRSMIYKLARINLEREIRQHFPHISDAELQQHLDALENAIERVEATHSGTYDNHVFRPDPDTDDSTQRLVDGLRAFDDVHEPTAQDVIEVPASEQTTTGMHEPAGQAVILAPQPPMALQRGAMLQVSGEIVNYDPRAAGYEPARSEPSKRIWHGIQSFIQLTAAALLAVAIFAVMTGQLDIRVLQKKPQAIAGNPAPDASKPAASNGAAREAAVPVVPAVAAPPFPLPSTYGVYAVSNDKLLELERLALRVPDPRVLISPDIREPSRITLPDGKVSFVVFRREFANGAPEKVSVRVVARIAREMTFTDGKASTSNVENLWRIRNNAFDFKVAPLSDSRDMIAIKPEADFVFPAGRYALVINGQGYDFSVAGPITSPLQCLERIETVNGAMYSECRSPQAR